MKNLKEIGSKWQQKWKETEIYKTIESHDKKKFYILDMFPYPSGSGLHVGHPKGYIATDVIARKKMLEGHNVLHPMGFDTFGLGTENYAIEHKVKPQDAAATNIKRFKEQLEMFGCTYDWNREVSTADPKFFKWTQWTFLQMYNHYFDEESQMAKPISELEDKLTKEGKSDNEIKEICDNNRLAYMDYQPINRCPQCKTGLANEDLEDGKCERCGSEIEQKPMRQWVIRITKYAERLLEGLKELDGWEDYVKDMQSNWIGKSEGTQFKFDIDGMNESFEVYTTRIDTVFGVSFVAIAPEHPLVDKITTSEYKDKVEAYQEQAKLKSALERTELQKDKTGQFCGAYAINPFNGEKVPVYVADYVLVNYGTGAVMAVPAHDERDFEFAKKYDIEVNPVIKVNTVTYFEDPEHGLAREFYSRPKALEHLPKKLTEKGSLINSGEFTGMTSEEATIKIQEWLENKGIGGKKNNYKIQDWVFSRQRYRGEPIPMIHCEKCGVTPLEQKDLPLLLPDVENYEPTGTEEGPLANVEEWVNTTCPQCGGAAKRETNTMPGWAGSSWYWIRYMDPNNEDELVNSDKEKYWDPVDVYVGGAEHITRHMIYARFWNKFLQDTGITTVSEPFQKYQKVGLIMAEDGRKMSKRRGNVINPDDIIEEFGHDTLRVYEMFMGPFDQAVSWSTNGVKGAQKLLEKIMKLYNKVDENHTDDRKVLGTLHKTIKKLTDDIDKFRFNTCISQLMIFVNELSEVEKISKDTFKTLTILLSPFAPHLAEELWELLGNEYSIFQKSTWPSYDEAMLVDDVVKIAVQFSGKVRGTIEIAPDTEEDAVMEIVKGDEKLAKYMENKEIKKVIYIKGKILNIVAI